MYYNENNIFYIRHTFKIKMNFQNQCQTWESKGSRITTGSEERDWLCLRLDVLLALSRWEDFDTHDELGCCDTCRLLRDSATVPWAGEDTSKKNQKVIGIFFMSFFIWPTSIQKNQFFCQKCFTRMLLFEFWHFSLKGRNNRRKNLKL